ncbi:MAG: DUF5915 domain-containing protein, partial [Bacillota bacterium]|nr:DUF5915 domain-containing protein [Bacillota bacterium]
ENKELFEEQFPADFICEGIDQTRGWFNSLLAISTFVMGKSPYKNVLVNDMILDKNGNKMSKSKGNTVDVFDFLDRYGADAIRWYMLYVSPAWLPTRFNEEALIEVSTKFFGTLRNLYNFFTLYANTDGIDAATIEIPYEERQELDWWILSKLNRLVRQVERSMDDFDHMKSVRAIHDFVIEDFSNWYIRRSRRRFWGSELTSDKRAVFRTTYEVLIAVSKLIAPFAPFLSEEMYRKLTGEESVHLADYPVCNEAWIDERIESRMDLVKELVRLGRSARESVKIKVRQPLNEAIVDGKHRDLIYDLVSLIEDELNVKTVTFEQDLPKYMDFVLKPNFKVLGPLLGSRIGAFGKALSAMDQGATAMALERGETVRVEFGEDFFDATIEHIMLNITAKSGFTVRLENNNFTILDTTLTPELIAEGYARELVSKVQQMRKAQDLDVSDHIVLQFVADDEFARAIESHKDFVAREVLATEVIRCEAIADGESDSCNGVDVIFKIQKV